MTHRRAVALLGVPGCALGIGVATVVVASTVVRVGHDAHGGVVTVTAVAGASAFLAAAAGAACIALFLRSARPGLAAFGLILAAVWHAVSLSALGLIGGVPILLAGIAALFALEEGEAPATGAAPDR